MSDIPDLYWTTSSRISIYRHLWPWTDSPPSWKLESVFPRVNFDFLLRYFSSEYVFNTLYILFLDLLLKSDVRLSCPVVSWDSSPGPDPLLIVMKSASGPVRPPKKT